MAGSRDAGVPCINRVACASPWLGPAVPVTMTPAPVRRDPGQSAWRVRTAFGTASKRQRRCRPMMRMHADGPSFGILRHGTLQTAVPREPRRCARPGPICVHPRHRLASALNLACAIAPRTLSPGCPIAALMPAAATADRASLPDSPHMRVRENWHGRGPSSPPRLGQAEEPHAPAPATKPSPPRPGQAGEPHAPAPATPVGSSPACTLVRTLCTSAPPAICRRPASR